MVHFLPKANVSAPKGPSSVAQEYKTEQSLAFSFSVIKIVDKTTYVTCISESFKIVPIPLTRLAENHE